MRDELLAYLLNDLDDEQRQRIEERLEVDPIWQHELERLRSYVEAAHDPQDDAEPVPEDLVSRTCSFVRQASSQGALSPAVLPPQLTESQDLPATRKSRWTLLDFAVVASILIVMGTLIAPAIQESREAARRAQCQAKLMRLGKALQQYAQQNQEQLPAIGRHENAGMYAVKLAESGVISPQELADSQVCPSSELADEIFDQGSKPHVPTREELHAATLVRLRRLVEQMGGSFAYRIGYYDRHGKYRQVSFTSSSTQPMMADKPSYDVVGFQSPHHGACGQNVLFQDGSVRYVQICIQTGPDKHWFLNEKDEHAAGMAATDIVMGRSEASPSGKIALINNRQRPTTIPASPVPVE